MLGVDYSQPSDNQPIQASILKERRLLTSWITPDSLEVQTKYEQLTKGLNSTEDKVLACLRFASDIPYVQFVKVSANVAGKTFVENDCWLQPSEAMQSPRLNCANKTYLLASLLRQELPAESVWACLGNLNSDSQNGHAFGYIRLDDKDYILETTNPSVKDKLIPIETVGNLYEDVIYFNDIEVKAVPEKQVREPFSACYRCLPFLQDYLARELCVR